MTSNELDDGNRVESTATSVREPRVPAIPRSRDPAALWRHSDFMKLWLAQTISVFGDQFTGLAIPLIAALMLQATPGQMGVLTAVERAPFLLIGLFAGVWVDRLPRRPILVAGDFGRAAVLLTIPLAALLGGLGMPHLYAVGVLVGVFTVFFDVAYQAFLPALVGRQQLVEGNSKLEATRSLANLAGPSVAGVVIQALSAPIAIILDALSFVISGGLISRIRGREPVAGGARAAVTAEVREGLRVVFGNRLLRSIAGCTGTSNFFGSALFALYILFMTRSLGLTPAKIGAIFSLGNVAGLLGALSAVRPPGRRGGGGGGGGAAGPRGPGRLPPVSCRRAPRRPPPRRSRPARRVPP